MARRTGLKNFQTLDGRHYTRITIPAPLRPYLGGKGELRHAHGDGLKQAERNHPAVVARFLDMLGGAKAQHAADHAPAKSVMRERPISLDEYARSFFALRAMSDRDARDASPVYASFSPDEGETASLKRIVAGLCRRELWRRRSESPGRGYRQIFALSARLENFPK